MPGTIIVGFDGGKGWYGVEAPTIGRSETTQLVKLAEHPCRGAWCYAAAFVAAAAAFSLRYMLFGPDEPRFPYLLALPVVVASAGILGLGPALTASFTGGALPAIFLLPPLRDLDVVHHVDRVALGAYLATSVGISYGVRAIVRTKLVYLAATMERQRLAGQANQLLFELRHRTKNELQQIVAMFHMQARVASSPTERATLKAMGQRVQAVGAIHDMVLESTQHPDDPVDTGAFLTGIVRKLRDGSVESALDWQVVIESHQLSHIVAIPLGLLLHELAMNAIKHGFPDHAVGAITVGFRRDGDHFVLDVMDDGIGFGALAPNPTGIGQRVMKGLTANLGCDPPQIYRHANGGTHCIVRFPVVRKTSSIHNFDRRVA